MTDRQGLGIAILRVVVGVVFLMHGGQKLIVMGFSTVAQGMAKLGFPAPEVAAVTATLVEFFGGILLIAGLFTKWAAILLAIQMAVAGATAHVRHGFFLPTGFEYTLVLCAACVMLALTGPGRAALDKHLTRRGLWGP